MASRRMVDGRVILSTNASGSIMISEFHVLTAYLHHRGMVKGNPKSSASSGTRKKHAKKHAPVDETPKEKRPKEKGRGKKKEPRVKMYIPPVKPAPVQPDPLETTGLAHTLPADLLVVLRNISKKAQVTKTRALEELQSAWVNQCLKEGRESLLTYTLVEMLPVWLHHVSALFVNPSRRVRFLASSLHSTLLQIPPVHDQILFFLRESTSEAQLESILGTWCLATYDVDRQVLAIASKSWKETISTVESPGTFFLTDKLQALLNAFIQRTALDPSGVYLYLNPLPPPPPAASNASKKGNVKMPGGKGSSVATPRKDDGDMTPRSKMDEQEESEPDRQARLRIGALGAARWIAGSMTTLTKDLLEFYSNPALWSILHSTESCPWVDMESFGYAQPNVRKTGWNLIQTLLDSHKDHLQTAVPIIGVAVLRSAWIELDSLVQSSMRQPLLQFLKQFPQCWTLESNKEANDHEGSESEADSDGEQEAPKHASSSHPKVASPAYEEFLAFLRSGCSGSPLQGYPTVLIIVSSIPSSLIIATPSDSTSPPLSHFFAAFWEALESRALTSLHRVTVSAAFLSSLLECVVFLVKRIRHDDTRVSEVELSAQGTSVSARTAGENLVRDQFARIWDALTSKKLKAEDRAAARLLAQTLESLLAVDQLLLDAAWDVLAKNVKATIANEDNATLVSASLKVFYDRFKKNDSLLKANAEVLMKEVLQEDLEQCQQALDGPASAEGEKCSGFSLLDSLIGQFREGLFADNSFADRLDNLLSQSAFCLLSLHPSLLLSYLIHRKDERKALIVWRSLLSNIASETKSDHVLDLHAFASLLGPAQKGQLPKYLTPEVGELDSLVGSLLENALDEPVGSNESVLVKQILASSGYFISASALDSFLQVIVATFTSNVSRTLQGEEISSSVFDVCIDLIQAVYSKCLEEPELNESILPDIFLYSYLIPVSMAVEGVETPTLSQVAGKTLWQEWLKGSSDGFKTKVVDVVKNRLKGLMEDTEAQPLPEDILRMIAQKPPGIDSHVLQAILPSSSHLDEALDALSSDAIDPSIAILEPLIPPYPSPTSKHKLTTPTSTDRRGFSAYARAVNALLQSFIEDRQLAKLNVWALRHLFALSLYAQDLQNVLSASSRSPVFDDKVTPVALSNIVTQIRHVAVYLLNSSAIKDDESWRRVVLDRLINEPTLKAPKEGLSQLQTFLFDVVSYAKNGDSVRDARVLRMVLDPLVQDGIEVAEADLWVQLSRKYERTAPQTTMTIIAVITQSGVEPSKLDRYRNELAASIPGIKATKANTEGLLTLRKLAASAPDPDSDTVFLQPPRAVNVVKGCQAWVLAEDDDEQLDEEVESAMLPIFVQLAPILQNVPGSHWGFVFDVLEAVFDRLSPAEDEEEHDENESASLVALARALRLLTVLEDLTKRNKALLAEWTERRIPILTIVRDLTVLGNDPTVLLSVPRSACRQLVLSIVQHLPSSLIDENTLPKMCHLIEDPSVPVQKMAYQLLKAAAQKRTEHFVIEAGVDTEAVVQATLPLELLEILQRDMSFGYDGEIDEDLNGGDQSQNLFGYLLGWMLVFDLFQDASFKVKSSYIEQLRDLNLVLDRFIPCFLGILHLNQGSLVKAFKLDIYSVDKFYVELYQPGNVHTIPVLTAHVYYRALLSIPSIIHTWILDCKDRQLTNIVTTYTSTYFSPVLIRSELEHVRSHSVSDGLADDVMSVKVANAVNEVAAAYSVDEHQLEIRLRIPPDWPLHKIEVRDVKRVGVDENRWRAWVLGVQQTIWAHNGRIIDGLGLFKKNVTLHFEGQVECAICYSIISVMDGTLPKKPCKTCKNRFHAGCLFKWFNSSHSSSCPLCRSDII
ncbi:hypothetical protein BDN70DRAFT_881303 [Pholiota conissans]|uniref:E3 ubiquitin-protein ligase listerin n=1 Tax=Pholiota conissans TaxID=109636 RepID=A0A9P5Z0B1_9AGAR|nr:hypothetical protein BDN70DRAFT_881303 [Pholiota conissans]